MKKVFRIILVSSFLFLFQNCSDDEQEVFEDNTKSTEEFTNEMIGAKNSDSDSFSICRVVYIFDDPHITPSEKEIIRKWYHYNHFFIYDYTSISNYKEIWTVSCQDFESYDQDYPNCDINGCYTSCARASCGSSPPKEDTEPEDPFE